MKSINLKIISLAIALCFWLAGCKTANQKPVLWEITRDVDYDGITNKCRIVEVGNGYAVSGVLDEAGSNAKQIVEFHNLAVTGKPHYR